MLAISRFRYDLVPQDGRVLPGAAAPDAGPAGVAAVAARAELGQALAELSRCAGFVGGTVGRALDDEGLWVLETRWESVGSYRRALSSYHIKMAVVPTLSKALDEPSAYEIAVGEGATRLNESVPRGAT